MGEDIRGNNIYGKIVLTLPHIFLVYLKKN